MRFERETLIFLFPIAFVEYKSSKSTSWGPTFVFFLSLNPLFPALIEPKLGVVDVFGIK